jgi:hypothetical protein
MNSSGRYKCGLPLRQKPSDTKGFEANDTPSPRIPLYDTRIFLTRYCGGNGNNGRNWNLTLRINGCCRFRRTRSQG